MNVAIVDTGDLGLSNSVLLAQYNTVVALDIVHRRGDLTCEPIRPALLITGSTGALLKSIFTESLARKLLVFSDVSERIENKSAISKVRRFLVVCSSFYFGCYENITSYHLC